MGRASEARFWRTGMSGRETWAAEGKGSVWFFKENVMEAEYWEGWTNPEAGVFWGGRRG